MKTSEFLTRAKGVIETEGWIQGDLFNAQGVCSEGAMKFAAIHHMTPGWHEGRKALRDKIYEMCGELSISRWNDEPGRTKREVLEVFEKTTAPAPAAVLCSRQASGISSPSRLRSGGSGT